MRATLHPREEGAQRALGAALGLGRRARPGLIDMLDSQSSMSS